mgnify:CR=1 FL=1
MKRQVLLVDLDPQGNATTGSGIEKQGLERSTLDALMGELPLAECIVRSEQAGYDVLPSNGDLTAAEVKQIGAGQQVSKESSNDAAHTHTVTFN